MLVHVNYFTLQNVRLGRGITNGKSAQSFQGTDKSFVSSSENSDSTNYSKQFDLTMDNSNDAGEGRSVAFNETNVRAPSHCKYFLVSC